MLALLLLAACAVAERAAAADIVVRLDARDVVRKKVHSDETISAAPGPLTLVYAKWMPGEHGPAGPLEQVVGLEIRANGQRLAWQRDPFDAYALHMVVPQGADHVDVSLETAFPDESGGFTNGQNSTEPLALLIRNDDFYRTLQVAYLGGPRFPHLTHIAGRADLLTPLMPRACVDHAPIHCGGRKFIRIDRSHRRSVLSARIASSTRADAVTR